MTALRRRVAGVITWLALALIVIAHVGLAALAVAEYLTLEWLARAWFDLAALSVVLATAAGGVAGAVWMAARAARGSLALHRLARSARVPCTAPIRDAAAGLRLGGQVDVVRGAEPFALTYRLLRPRILVSTGLAESLGQAGISAVLAHEYYHVRHRDPLRLLAIRLAVAYGWWLPASAWLARTLTLRRELAADLAAASLTSRAAVAGALLKLASAPRGTAMAAASPAGDEPGSLEARVAQLEGSRLPRSRLALGRLLVSGGTLALVAAACLCCAGLSLVLVGGPL